MFYANRARTRWQGLLVILSLSWLAACTGEGKPVRGFVLPEGDIGQGEQVFLAYRCHHCHTIPEKEFPKLDAELPFVLEIGGKVLRVKNYGELLTAVVNPDHVISPKYRRMLREAGKEPEISPMPDFTGEMSVEELIDLVAFLHAQYTKLQPDYYHGYYMTK